jgi:hypothetical protein
MRRIWCRTPGCCRRRCWRSGSTWRAGRPRLQLAGTGANSGAKALSVIGSMLAGGDSIDDVAVLRAGAAARVRRHAGAVDGRVVAAGAQVVQRPAARRDQP